AFARLPQGGVVVQPGVGLRAEQVTRFGEAPVPRAGGVLEGGGRGRITHGFHLRQACLSRRLQETRAPLDGRAGPRSCWAQATRACKGQRGLTSKAYEVVGSCTPACRRMAAARAIMAPLSVQRASSG